MVPIIDPLRPTLERVTYDRGPEDRLIVGPKGGVITTATLRDATNWDQLVIDLGLDGLVRHGLRHTALTWMADSGVTSPNAIASIWSGWRDLNSRPLDPQDNQVVRRCALQCDFERKTALDRAAW